MDCCSADDAASWGASLAFFGFCGCGSESTELVVPIIRGGGGGFGCRSDGALGPAHESGGVWGDRVSVRRREGEGGEGGV